MSSKITDMARVERRTGRTKPGDRRDGSICSKFSSLPERPFSSSRVDASSFELCIIVFPLRNARHIHISRSELINQGRARTLIDSLYYISMSTYFPLTRHSLKEKSCQIRRRQIAFLFPLLIERDIALLTFTLAMNIYTYIYICICMSQLFLSCRTSIVMY